MKTFKYIMIIISIFLILCNVVVYYKTQDLTLFILNIAALIIQLVLLICLLKKKS